MAFIYFYSKEEIKMENLYYTAQEIAEMLGVSRGHAYKIIKQLNAELADRGYIIIAGKISKKYFAEHYYGLA